MTIKNDQKLRTSRQELITIDDLESFKTQLFDELRKLLKAESSTPAKKWMKSSEVKKLLGMSTGTLQTLRMNGTLSHSKIGGIIYYNHDEIQKLLKDNEQR